MMKYAVSVMDTDSTKKIEASGKQILKKLQIYARHLNKLTEYELPRGIVFHDLQSATELYSTIPLPAYTSRNLIHITPLVDTWKEIYLSSASDSQAASDYFHALDLDDVAAIAAHELTHHADFFHSEFETWEEEDEEDMWFEEGMCEYLPRKFMFSEEKLDKILSVEADLIERFKSEFGMYPLSSFGKAGYRGGNSQGYATAFYDYWRSCITVMRLIEEYCDGEVEQLIAHYRDWVEGERKTNLQNFFIGTLELNTNQAKELWLK
ncbi:hypothetical protein [Thalassobacillus hwangdonensis]|uniref:DUF1570 domain-containing protein n=1 Tax=Thalassobacillus hwangdonensis TaxID=546108 RepID=A0ABW3KXJ7_9BACI